MGFKEGKESTGKKDPGTALEEMGESELQLRISEDINKTQRLSLLRAGGEQEEQRKVRIQPWKGRILPRAY